jgi:hypothetical protein
MKPDLMSKKLCKRAKKSSSPHGDTQLRNRATKIDLQTKTKSNPKQKKIWKKPAGNVVS